jgi:hypothetical protein
MSLLKGLTSDESIANERDSVGGTLLDSGLYLSKVKLVYVTKSAGGAIGLVIHLQTDQGRDIRETVWMTNKDGRNYYEKDGQKNYLPGYLTANALALLTTGQEIGELDTETKVVNVYNREVKTEVPTKVEVPTDILGKEVLVGLIRQKVDKTAKNEDGKYVPTGETREENTIDKFFRASDRKTTAEIRAQAEEAVFVNTWASKFTGQTRDRTSKTSGGTAGAPKAAAGLPAASSKPKQSLFA